MIDLKTYQPSLYENAETIAARIDPDPAKAIDLALTELETAGWTFEKFENSYGAFRDSNGELHLMHHSASYASAVIDGYCLLQQYRKLGWSN